MIHQPYVDNYFSPDDYLWKYSMIDLYKIIETAKAI